MRRRGNPALVLTALGLTLGSAPISATAQLATCPRPDPAAGGPVNAHTRHVETMMLPAVIDEKAKPRTLAERMAAWQVPGVTVAVMKGGKLDWARGWGVRELGTCAPVTPDTMFQAASISKPVFAVAVMKLAEARVLDIDADIAKSLKSWQLPAAPAVSDAPITLRQLLSHTAGLTIHGFPGYERNEAVPTLIGTLNGEPIPRSFAAQAGGASHADGVVRELAPGTQWKYSGGGYVLAQQVVEDVTGEPLEATAQRLVLGPLGMNRSSFAQPPAVSTLADASSGHANARLIAGGFNLYPQQGAAGLWTTPTDLTRLFGDVRRATRGELGAMLNPASAAALTTPGLGDWAVGFGVRGQGADRTIHHGGANAGFRNFASMFLDSGDGVIVMTNSDSGGALADEIIRAVANDYGWTSLASQPLRDVPVPLATLEAYPGYYAVGPVEALVTLVDGRLYARTGGPLPERLVMLSPTRFRASISGVEGEFERGADGSVSGIRVVAGAPAMLLARGSAPAGGFASEPILLRGSMNDWGTAQVMAAGDDGQFVTDVTLAPGDYEFKLGSADWRTADLGADGLMPVATDGTAMSLLPRGANILLKISTGGVYRFKLSTDAAGAATLAVTKAD